VRKTLKGVLYESKEKSRFGVKLVELDGLIGIIIEYNGRKIYLPPIITCNIVPLPKKYAEMFDKTLFPEIVGVPYGSIDRVVIR